MIEAVFLLLLLLLLFGVAMQAKLARLAVREIVPPAPPPSSTARKRHGTPPPLETQESVRAPASRPPRPQRGTSRAASLRRDIVMMEILGPPRALREYATRSEVLSTLPARGAAWFESTMMRSTEDQRQHDREQQQDEDADRSKSC
jgi:hypothetical protein